MKSDEMIDTNFFEEEQSVLEDSIKLIEESKEKDSEMLKQMEKLVKNYKKILKQTNKLLKVSDSQQGELKKTQNNLKNLLDNARQGFLSFSSDLLINKEYSAECEKILGSKIEHKKLSDILFNPSDDIYINFDMVMNVIFDEKDSNLIDICFKLLPEEIIYDNKDIHMEYTVINSNEDTKTPELIMVILTDITEKRKLERKMEEERKVLKMIVSCTTNYKYLFKIISEYKEFSNHKINSVLDGELTNQNKINSILGEVHTFKGNFGQIDFFNTAKCLHNFETSIIEYKKTINDKTLNDIKEYIQTFLPATYLDKDMKILREVLGEQFFERKDKEGLSKTEILKVEKKISELLIKEEADKILPEIRKLRHEEFTNILNPYIEYVKKLAEQMSKVVECTIQSDIHIMIDSDKYYEFSKTLVHVFRNSIDHAIESPEERLLKGKNYMAKITCDLHLDGENIILKISDDGRGIDIEKIKKKATEKNIYSEDEIENIEKDELISLIFTEDFSTRDETTEISGRGIGLNAVKIETDKIGGKIDIKTQKDIGTEMIFVLPVMYE